MTAEIQGFTVTGPAQDLFTNLAINPQFVQAKTFVKGQMGAKDYIDYQLPVGSSVRGDAATTYTPVLRVVGDNLVVDAGGHITSGTVTQYQEFIPDDKGGIRLATAALYDISIPGKDFDYYAFTSGDLAKLAFQNAVLANGVIETSYSQSYKMKGGPQSDLFKILPFTGAATTHNIFGYGGSDTVQYSNQKHTDITSFSIDRASFVDPKIAITLKDSQGTTINDTLWGVEKIKLSDGYLIYDIPTTADNFAIYRLYKAAFARTPDESGFRYWVGQHDKGVAVGDMASSFRTSAEFQQKYGANLSNNDYVYTLYKNVLGREPDAGGLKYWQDNLNSGSMTRDGELLSFAASAENVKLTAQNTDNGYWFT